MPRVSAEHLAARRQQFVDAATRCFIRDGFHGTSMQDVIKEAGLSVGAFYRYFRSKADLIRAIAEEVISGVAAPLDTMAASPAAAPDLVAAIGAVLDLVEPETGPDGRLRVALQAWAESMRDPELAAVVADLYTSVRLRFVALATRAIEMGKLPADADPEEIGSVLFGIVQGYILQRLLIGKIDRASYLAGLRALLTPPVPGPSIKD